MCVCVCACVRVEELRLRSRVVLNRVLISNIYVYVHACVHAYACVCVFVCVCINPSEPTHLYHLCTTTQVDTRPHYIVRRYAEYSGALMGINGGATGTAHGACF